MRKFPLKPEGSDEPIMNTFDSFETTIWCIVEALNLLEKGIIGCSTRVW